jgi:hypothetical protein
VLFRNQPTNLGGDLNLSFSTVFAISEQQQHREPQPPSLSQHTLLILHNARPNTAAPLSPNIILLGRFICDLALLIRNANGFPKTTPHH